MACASSRVFGSAARSAGVSAGGSSSCGIDVSFRVFRSPRYRPYWLVAPASPLAVASALRFFLAEPDGTIIKPNRRILSSSSPPYRVLPSEPWPTCRSTPAPLLDFCSLQHIRVRKSTSRGVSTSRFVPPAGFGHPLDGLLLPSPRRPYFVPAALLGFRPSESSPLERSPPHSCNG
jgi:hypothetical protein